MTALARSVDRAMRRMDQRAGLMQQMMVHLDIDADSICETDAALAMWGAVRSCTFCGSVGRCMEWLAQDGEKNGYRAFCPNAGILDHLRQY